MEIRGIEPPIDEVKAEVETSIAYVARGMKYVKAEELEADIWAMKLRRETSAMN
jgi:hypothetical protein